MWSSNSVQLSYTQNLVGFRRSLVYDVNVAIMSVAERNPRGICRQSVIIICCLIAAFSALPMEDNGYEMPDGRYENGHEMPDDKFESGFEMPDDKFDYGYEIPADNEVHEVLNGVHYVIINGVRYRKHATVDWRWTRSPWHDHSAVTTPEKDTG